MKNLDGSLKNLFVLV